MHVSSAPFRVGMFFLACTEPVMKLMKLNYLHHVKGAVKSPVSETQDYVGHHVKGAVKSWSFRDDMCRIESQ